MISEASMDVSRRRSPLLLPVRVLLRWVIKALVLLFLGVRFLLRPRAVRYSLLVLLVGGGVAWKLLGEPALLTGSTGAVNQETISTVVVDQLPRPPAVERYFEAQAAYDARSMWETMNEQLQRRMAASNNSPDQLQKELDTARQQERRYTSVAYVGGQELTGGRAAYFYVLTVDGPNGSTRLPYTFILDQDGKITNVQWSMDR